eukprot:487066-Rhodomonas_salina.1
MRTSRSSRRRIGIPTSALSHTVLVPPFSSFTCLISSKLVSDCVEGSTLVSDHTDCMSCSQLAGVSTERLSVHAKQVIRKMYYEPLQRAYDE